MTKLFSHVYMNPVVYGTTIVIPGIAMGTTREKCWTTIKMKGPEGVAGRAGATIDEVHVKARLVNGVAEARFRHRYKSGAPRKYPSGLEMAITAWMENWGWGGLSLQTYIHRMFHKKRGRHNG